MRTQKLGDKGEQIALAHLRQHGLRLIQRNFRCRMGEVDLIMADRSPIASRVLVFVEVRLRSTNRYGGAAASVTPAKQKRLIRTAHYYLQQHTQFRKWPCRFDVVALTGETKASASQSAEVNWIKNAFGV